jgi:hypothetical protein
MPQYTEWDGRNREQLASLLRGDATERVFYGTTFLDESPSLANYWVGKRSLQFYTYLCLLIAGGSKQKEPLVSVDSTLSAALNGRGYFSYALGEVYSTQRETALAALALRNVGTLLFAPVYNLQKATTRPRIWSLSLVPVREEGKWVLVSQAIMGHCTVWPMLPYELLGAFVISQLLASASQLPLLRMQWCFHCLSLPKQWPDGWVSPDVSEVPSKLPSTSAATELLAAEAKLRRNPQVRPHLRIPVSVYDTAFLDGLQKVYAGRANANQGAG